MAAYDPSQYKPSSAGAPNTQPAQPRETFAGKVTSTLQETALFKPSDQRKEDQTFLRKVGEDAKLLGLAPSAVVATGVDLVTHPIETTKQIGAGFVDGFKAMFDGQEWKDHPLLNTVNTVANISVVGGIIKSAVLNGARSTLVTTAKASAVKAGMEAPIANALFKKKGTLKNAVKEGEKLNSPEPVIGAIAKEFQNGGMEKSLALKTAGEIGESVFSNFLKENKTKLKTVDTIAHPISALGKSAKYVSNPVAKAVFGSPEKSAVGKLYGSKIVKQDIPGFAVVEEWAGMQVKERGIANTVANRVRQIDDWVETNAEYTALTPLERNKHFAAYAKADLLRQKFAKERGRKYILTKALPKNVVEAIQDFVKKADSTDSKGNVITNGRLIDNLKEEYGADFSKHYDEVRNRMVGNLDDTNRAALLKAVSRLGDSRVPVTMGKLTKAESVFIKKLEGSGYRIGRQPKKTIVSQATDITGKAFSKEDLVVQRSTLGRVIDKFGLSPQDIVEGVQFFQFRESMIQKLVKEYGFAKNITIKGSKYPVRSLVNTLEDFRRVEQRNVSGIFPSNYTIADLRFKNLKKMGFSDADAKIVDKIIRKSTVTDPAVVGLGEALSGIIKTGNNPFSKAYNSFLRVQSDLRFKKNPMFAMQAAVETIAWGALFNKRVPGTAFLKANIARVKEFKTPIVKAVKEPSMRHQQIVQEVVLKHYNRQLRDASAPEIYKGTSGIKGAERKGLAGFSEEAAFKSSTADSNIFLGAAGFSNVKITTNLMKSYAEKFGMTLDDALAHTFTPDGKTKVFKNPQMVQRMQDAAQGIFGYKGTGLNSPLIRTLNTMFFPLRFTTKSVVQTSQWLSDLSPASRLAVINQWTASAQWMTTPEGKEWKNKNRGKLASFFNYTFAYEGLGKTVDAVTKGELFGGNTGQIGGLPFGFVFSFAKEMGYMSESEQINTTTGKPFKRTVIKDPTSFPAFVKGVETIVLSMTPAMPFYTASGGEVTVSLNRGIRRFVQQTMAATAGGIDPEKDFKDYQREINRSEKKVKPEFKRDIFE